MQLNKSYGHVNNKSSFVPYVKDETGKLIKASDNEIRLPNIECLKGFNRLQPLTAINTSQVLTQQEVVYQIGSGLSRGVLENLHIEITLKNNDAVKNAFFNIYNIFQRVEITDEKGGIFRTIYPDEFFYVNILYRDLESHNILQKLEYLDSNYTPVYPTINNNGATRTFIMEFPLFKNKMVDLRGLKNTLMLRFFFKTPANFALLDGGLISSTDLSIVSMYLLSKEVNIPRSIYNQTIYQRYINYTRFVQTLNLVPSQTVDIQLNTFSGYSPFIFFMLRPQPVETSGENFANLVNLSSLSKWEFRDSSNNIVGIDWSLLESRYFINSVFNSDFLSKANSNIVIVPFALYPQLAENGAVSGGYQMSTREILHLQFDATLPPGQYELAVWQASYETFGITPSGEMLYTK